MSYIVASLCMSYFLRSESIGHTGVDNRKVQVSHFTLFISKTYANSIVKEPPHIISTNFSRKF